MRRAEFDEGLFAKEMRTLHEVIERGARKPPQDLSYTIFVLELLWLAVVAPFLMGTLAAFLLGR